MYIHNPHSIVKHVQNENIKELIVEVFEALIRHYQPRGDHSVLTRRKRAHYAQAYTQALEAIRPLQLVHKDPAPPFSIPTIGDIRSTLFCGSQAELFGWLPLDGQAICRKKYKKLFNILGLSCTVGDDGKTFNIPSHPAAMIKAL